MRPGNKGDTKSLTRGVVLGAIALCGVGVGVEAYTAQAEEELSGARAERPGILTAPKVADDVDVGRYVGRWYEIESTRPGFQAGCSCVTAEYGLVTPTEISVVNTCRKEGRVDRVEGAATIPDASQPAKLKVDFPGFAGRIVNLFLRSNYWIVDLDAEYRWAAVSTRFRRPVWILARTPTLDAPALEGIKARLEADGFDVGALQKTQHEGCVYAAP